MAGSTHAAEEIAYLPTDYNVLTMSIYSPRITKLQTSYWYEGIEFVWDPDKAKGNVSKHGIHFEDAVATFFDPLFKVIDASRNAERRDAVIGFDAVARLLLVVHIEEADDQIRIISARRATPQEESIYAS